MSRTRIDMTGQRYGKWTVLGLGRIASWKHNHVPLWKCRCDCGREGLIPRGNLTAGYSTQCARCAYEQQKTVIAGARFGSRVVTVRGERRCKWNCDCGASGSSAISTVAHRATKHCRRCWPRPNGLASSVAKAITVNGETHTLKDWGAKLGLSRYTVSLRLKNGWPADLACTVPSQQGQRKRGAA